MVTKTSIAFGLVYIPVKLSVAAKHTDVGFNMLDKSGSRIRYKKVNANGDEVNNDDIIRGYEYEKNKYVTFTDDELEKLKTEKDKQINIVQFVSVSEIDPIYYEKSYYLTPTGGEKAYSLFVSALGKQKKVGIAKAVLGNKEQVVAVRVCDDCAVLSTLYFADEIISVPQVKKSQFNKEELTLACTLIDNMTKPFKPEEYSDEYRNKLMAAIKNKIDGKEITTQRDDGAVNVLNLLDALKASVSGEAYRGV